MSDLRKEKKGTKIKEYQKGAVSTHHTGIASYGKIRKPHNDPHSEPLKSSMLADRTPVEDDDMGNARVGGDFDSPTPRKPVEINDFIK